MVVDRCRKFLALTFGAIAVFGGLTSRTFGQSGSQGTVEITVDDSSGAVVSGASLSIVALRTNDVRVAETAGNGTYTFVNLPIGTCKLTVAKPGYSTAVYDAVLVQASQITNLTTALSIGRSDQTVRVTAESTPLIETSSSAIGMVVDMKQIEDLPLQGRDLTAFSQLVAGYNGTFNGLPSTDQGSNIDGVIGSSPETYSRLYLHVSKTLNR
jgi:hypothetical protein